MQMVDLLRTDPAAKVRRDRYAGVHAGGDARRLITSEQPEKTLEKLYVV